jgi:hypothetical protein
VRRPRAGDDDLAASRAPHADGTRRGVSRRDLLGGILRRPVDEVRTQLGAPGAAKPAFTYPRRQRPADHTVRAVRDDAGRYRVDLAARPLAGGMSWRVVADDLAEALVLVRVSADHVAAATGECPLDRSDLFFQRQQDVLWCAGCGSQWSLDGEVVRGPARGRLLSLHVDEVEGIARIDVP